MEFHKILIAIDNRPSSKEVAMAGLQIAKQFNSEIAIVSIVDPDNEPDNDPPTRKERDDMMEQNYNKNQLDIMAKIFKEIPVKSFIEKGNPYKSIIEISKKWGADIIIVGTHGRKGLTHLFLGSVAENVIRHSKKSVVVIPVVN